MSVSVPPKNLEQRLEAELRDPLSSAVKFSENKAKRRAAQLHEVTTALSKALSIEDVARIVVGEAYAAVEAASVLAYVATSDGSLKLLAARGIPDFVLDSFRVLRADAALPIPTAVRERRAAWFQTQAALFGSYPVLRNVGTPHSILEAAAVLPLLARDGVIGGLGFTFGSARSFDEEERAFLLTLANHAALAFERGRLYQEERAARQRLSILAEASQRFTEAKLELSEILATVTRELALRLGDTCAINLVSEDEQVLNLVALHAVNAELEASVRHVLAEAPVLMSENSVLAQVAKTGSPLLIPVVPLDSLLESIRPEYREHIQRFPFSSLAVVPLRVHEKVIGTMTLTRAPGFGPLTRDDQALLQDLADRASFAIQNARLFEAERRAHAEAEELRAKVDEARALAEEAAQQRADMLAIASHDLRNPLAAIRTSASLLQRMSTDKRVLHQAETIERAGSRMQRLIHDMLDCSRIQAGVFDVHVSPTDVGVILDEVAELEPLATAKGLRLEIKRPTAAARVSCEPDRIAQVLSNLIGNAIRFSPDSGSVEVGVELYEEQVEFRVRDHGPGIQSTQMRHIFGKFWSNPQPTNRAGLGLGLFIARGIVAAHGGELWAENLVDGGVRFAFTLQRI